MKSIISTLVFIFLVQIVFAQETVQIKYGSKKTYYNEIYNVLKSNKFIKHGHYQKLNKNNQLIIDGYYKLDEKDSLWTEYDNYGNIETQGYYKNDKKTGLWTEYNGKYIQSQGSYKNGIKNELWETFYYQSNIYKNKGTFSKGIRTGIWEFYRNDGSLEQKYDYDKREILFEDLGNSYPAEIEILTDSGYTTVVFERPATVIGGSSELYSHLQSNIKYPEVAMDNGIEGTVFVDFIVNKQGIARDYNIETPLGGGLDQESIRVLQLISNDWIPAIVDGSPATVKMRIPIKFKLTR